MSHDGSRGGSRRRPWPRCEACWTSPGLYGREGILYCRRCWVELLEAEHRDQSGRLPGKALDEEDPWQANAIRALEEGWE